MRSTLLACAVSAAAGALSVNATAGTVTTEGQDIVIKTKGGFEAKTADKAFSFKIGGRVQAQYDSFNDSMNLIDGDGSTGSDLFIRRARVYLKGTVYDDWAYKIQFNVADSGSGGGTFEDLYIRWQGANWANITVGKHKEPFSLQELTSSKWVSTVERAANVDFFAEGRAIGISVGGANNFGGYHVGLFDNGNNDDENKQLWAFTGRGHLSPINKERSLLHLGLGLTTRDLDDSNFDGGEVTQGIKKGDDVAVGFADGAQGERRNAINAELAGKAGPFHAQAEANWRRTDVDGSDSEDVNTNGWYVQAGWFITGESRIYKKGKWDKVKPNKKGVGAWELVARVEGLNFDDDGIAAKYRNKGNIYTIGANWYPNEIIRISANYVQANWNEDLAEGLKIEFDPCCDSEPREAPTGELVRADSFSRPESKGSGRGFTIRMQAAF